jgi:hypothetical protein
MPDQEEPRPTGEHPFEAWTSTRANRRERSFDELAKGLASGGVSRRQALRLMSGVILGGVLASIPGGTLAQPGPPPEVPPPGVGVALKASKDARFQGRLESMASVSVRQGRA